MKHINVSCPHQKPTEEVKGYVEEYAQKLNAKFKIDSHWVNDNTLAVKRSGLTGTLSFTDSHVNIDLKLGFMLAAFKSVIEDGIKENLAEKLR